jgi:hypothetical protein
MLERDGISPIRQRNSPEANAALRLLPSTQRTTKEAVAMTNPVLSEEALDIEALVLEIASYLAAVEVFRAEGHEPCWS